MEKILVFYNGLRKIAVHKLDSNSLEILVNQIR